MSPEPLKRELEAQVKMLNRALTNIADTKQDKPFDFEREMEGVEIKIPPIPEGKEFVAFWNEWCCTDSLYAASTAHSMLETESGTSQEDPQFWYTMIRSKQGYAARAISTWLGGPNRNMTALQRASCRAYASAIQSFSWVENPGVLTQVTEIAHNLSRTYHQLR